MSSAHPMDALHPELDSLIVKALKSGMKMPINWSWYEQYYQDRAEHPEWYPQFQDEELEEDSASPEEKEQESEQDEELEDSDSPEEQESVQGEDDPEEKDVRDDCGSQTTEDCHGGDEATRSIESSPSVADDGQEDRDSDQTSNDENDNESTPSEEQSDGDSSGGESSTTDSAEENQGTSENQCTDEADNQDTAESAAALKYERLQNVLSVLQQHAAAVEQYEVSDSMQSTCEKIFDTIVEICKSAAKGVRNQQSKWDVRAMARDICCFRRDRVLRDKHWVFAPKRLAIFWDQSGSCDRYFAAVADAVKEVANLGYRCWLYDCSNGIQEKDTLCYFREGDPDRDNYNNGPRLRGIAAKIGCHTDDKIICPNAADFIKICQQFDTVIVLQDYDNIESVWFAARGVESRKCPHFIDLEERRMYQHPCQHNWNPHMRPTDNWPVPDRWHKIREM